MTDSDGQAPEQTYVQMPEQVLMPELMAVALGGSLGDLAVPGALVLDAVPGCPRPETDACNATLLDKADAGYRQHHCNALEHVGPMLTHSCVCGKDWDEVSTP